MTLCFSGKKSISYKNVLKVCDMLLLFQPRTTLIWAWLIISDAGYFLTNKEGPNSADFCFRTLLLVLHGNTIIDVYLDSIGISY